MATQRNTPERRAFLDARAAVQIARGERLAKARAKSRDDDVVWFTPVPRRRKDRLPRPVDVARFTKKHTEGRVNRDNSDFKGTSLTVEFLHLGMTL